MKTFKYQITIIFLILLIVSSTSVYNNLKDFNNTNIEFVNTYKQIENKRNSFYEMIWNTFNTKSKISGISKETFIQITKVIMDSRKDGVNVTWKWLQENQNIDYAEYSNFYLDLSKYIETKRNDFYLIDLEAQNLVLKQNNFLMKWPNKFINNWFFNFELLNFKSFKNNNELKFN